MKYEVTIQMTKATFETYATAMEYFRKTWRRGLYWSIVKKEDEKVIFAD